VAICDPRDFICTNLNLLVLRMIHDKYECIQTSGSWGKDFLKFLLYKPIYTRGPRTLKLLT